MFEENNFPVMDVEEGSAEDNELEKATQVTQRLLNLMTRTKYRIVQVNGQRKYGGPPPGWQGPPPPRGSEVFVGKIPRDCFEDELVPVFERIGFIYELRLMMDFSGSNRGYAFVMYTNPQDAERAIDLLDNYEIRPNRHLGVVKSVNNCRLFFGGLPVIKTKEEVKRELCRLTEGVVSVGLHSSSTDKSKRVYALVEYDSHRSAAMARRKLIPERVKLWGHDIVVDWAQPDIQERNFRMSSPRSQPVQRGSPLRSPSSGSHSPRSFASSPSGSHSSGYRNSPRHGNSGLLNRLLQLDLGNQLPGYIDRLNQPSVEGIRNGIAFIDRCAQTRIPCIFNQSVQSPPIAFWQPQRIAVRSTSPIFTLQDFGPQSGTPRDSSWF